jgi:hypothetical protein
MHSIAPFDEFVKPNREKCSSDYRKFRRGMQIYRVLHESRQFAGPGWPQTARMWMVFWSSMAG